MMINSHSVTLVDSHCHLDRLKEPLSLILEEAEKQDVRHMLCVSVVLEKFQAMLNLVESFPNIHVSVGLHPDEILEAPICEPSVDDLIHLGKHKKCVAIGETGLDYYRGYDQIEIQQQRFRNHIQAARLLAKPLIIHTRQASVDTIKIMQEEKAFEAKGVMHCFTEAWEVAKQALDCDFYISFSGIITFKNAEAIRDVVKKVPIDRLLIETDSPYLAPVPYRGKTNQPAYVRYVAEQVASLKNLSYEEVAAVTTENYFRLFPLASL